MTNSTRPRRIALLAAGLAALAATAVGCSGGSGDDTGAASTATERTAGGGDSGARDFGGAADGTADRGVADQAAVDAPAPGNPVAGADLDDAEAVIHTGTVSLRSDEASRARRDVQLVVDRFRGSIAQEETYTDDEGDLESSRLVLRVPAASFDDVMQALEATADLVSSDVGSEDVTVQVRDVEVRIRAQEKSLERVEALLARAQDLQEIVAIEAQLTRRQADLDALKSKQAYLADQTQQATITVHLEQAPEEAKEKEERAGFLGGLAGGWEGLREALGGLALAAGYALPFLVLLALLGVPAWLAARSLRARRPATDPTPEA